MSSERYLSIPKKGLADKSAKPFKIKIRGHIFRGFVVREKDKYFAYQNLCQHLPITLDLNDGNFFTHDKKHLQCHMHGAMYEISTGYCVAGPCQGAKLVQLELEEDSTHVIVKIPDQFGLS